MVLLQLTPSLRNRLDVLAPRLPDELREQVAVFLVGEDDVPASSADGKRTGERAAEASRAAAGRTIPHELLVRASRWARGRDDMEDSGARNSLNRGGRRVKLTRAAHRSAPPGEPAASDGRTCSAFTASREGGSAGFASSRELN